MKAEDLAVVGTLIAGLFVAGERYLGDTAPENPQPDRTVSEETDTATNTDCDGAYLGSGHFEEDDAKWKRCEGDRFAGGEGGSEGGEK